MTIPDDAIAALAANLTRLHKLRARLLFDLSLVDEMAADVESALCRAKSGPVPVPAGDGRPVAHGVYRGVAGAYDGTRGDGPVGGAFNIEDD